VKEQGEEENGEDGSEVSTAMRRNLNSSQKQMIVTYYFRK
jgi:hypothetical protein